MAVQQHIPIDQISNRFVPDTRGRLESMSSGAISDEKIVEIEEEVC
jgi:hypothetical protein